MPPEGANAVEGVLDRCPVDCINSVEGRVIEDYLCGAFADLAFTKVEPPVTGTLMSDMNAINRPDTRTSSGRIFSRQDETVIAITRQSGAIEIIPKFIAQHGPERVWAGREP